MSQLIGGTSDPLLARAIRRCEDVEQNSRTERSALNTERNDAWLAGYLIAEMDGDGGIIGNTLAQAIAQLHDEIEDEWRAEVDKLKARITELEQTASLAARFADLERNLDLRQQTRDQMKKGERGERGARGEIGRQGRPGKDGRDGVTTTRLLGIKKIIDDPEDPYAIRIVMADGTRSAKYDLRPKFQHFLDEVDLQGQINTTVNAALRAASLKAW